MRRLCFAATYLVPAFLSIGATVGILSAQSRTSPGVAKVPGAAFDVVSMRQVDKARSYSTANGLATVTTAIRPCQYRADRVLCQLPFKGLIQEAFQLKKTEMAGLLTLDNDLFLVQAVMPQDTDRSKARLMLQHALTERFNLKFHREERVVPVLALIQSKRGAKLQPADDSSHRKLLDLSTAAGGRAAVMTMSPGQFTAVAMSLDSLADDLNSMAGIELPVVNLTGLTGEYKIDLHWTPAEEMATSSTILDSGFQDAVQGQLGLKLEKRQFHTSVFVVDHVDRLPTEN